MIEKVDRYLQLIRELDLKLVKAVDTHLHADHVTGLGALRDRTHCITVMGEQSKADVVSMRLARRREAHRSRALALDVLYTPGHTDNSYSYLMGDRVFTGDTLLIRGTGRTDFQNGDPRAQYNSIFNKLLKLPEDTLVYPAHDYKGETVSTIGEEKAFNPRLQVKSVDEYVALMNNLKLPNPKMMDVAVPANMKVGLAQDEIARRGWAVNADARRWRWSASRTSRSSTCARRPSAKARRDPGLAACALPRPRANIAPGGHAARACGEPAAAAVLLRVRRALRHGGAGRAGRAARLRLPPAGRHRRLEEGERAAGALSEADVNTEVSGLAHFQVIDPGGGCPSPENWRKLRPRLITGADMT